MLLPNLHTMHAASSRSTVCCKVSIAADQQITEPHVNLQAVPDSGYFSIPRDGRPDAQVARAIQMMLATLRCAPACCMAPQTQYKRHCALC
jgi:hypothetical protein